MEHGLEYTTFYVKKHIAPLAICSNPPLARDKLIGPPVFMRPVYQENIKVPVMRMMKSSNGNIFRVTGHLCGEFTGPRWIPHTKAGDAELWCLLWSAPE